MEELKIFQDVQQEQNFGLKELQEKLRDLDLFGYRQMQGENEEIIREISLVYKEFGKTFDGKKDFESAIYCFKKSIEMDSENIKNQKQCFQLIALSGSKANNFQISVEYYIQLLEYMPDNKVILFNIALAMNNLQRYEDSIEYYKKAFQVDKRDISTVLNLGSIYFKLGQLQQAEEQYLIVKEIDYKDSRAYFNLGMTYNKMGKYLKAIYAFKSSIQYRTANDTGIKPYINLAESYINIKDSLSAYQVYQNVKRQQEGNDLVYITFSKLFWKNNQKKIAIDILESRGVVNPEILQSIKNDTMRLAYQQQMRLREMKIVKYELCALYKNDLYKKMFRREINEEIVDFFVNK